MSDAIVKHQGGELFNVSMERFDGAFKLAHTLAASGMFPDAKTAEKACVKVMAGMEMGIAPMAAMTGIHVIEVGGRVSVTAGANLMAQCVKEHPDYDYKVNEFTKERCEIEFYSRGADGEMTSLGISDFDMKDAKAAGVSMNAGSSWSKFPRNMLFARAVSNGFKWYCPNAIGGLRVYTPEEVGAPVNDDGDLDISKAKFADSVEIEKEKVGSPQGSLVLEGDRKKFDDVMTWAREDQIITEEVYEKSMEWKATASSPKLRKKTSEWEKKRERWNDVNCPQLIEALGGDDDFNTTTLQYISGDVSKDDYLSTFNSLKEAWDVDPEEENEDAPATLAVSTQEKIVETQMMIDEKDDDSVIGDELWSRLAALALVSGSQTIFQMQIRTAWHALDETISVQSVGDFSYASAPAATARKAFKFLVQKLSSK
jgi:hypothetical protein